MEPSQALIDNWKYQYDEIFSLEANGIFFVFRALTFAEYDHILLLIDDDSSSVDLEDALIKDALLWPQDFDPNVISPGVVANIANEIKHLSCLDGDVLHGRDVLEGWRTKVNGVRGEMKSFVLFALPQYTSQNLDDFTFYRLAELVAYAEQVIYLRQLSEGMQVDQPIRLRLYTQEELEEMNKAKVSDKGNATVADPIAKKLMDAM
jgi:hypothetical protein